MKNVTVSVDDGVYRRAELKASEMDTSLTEIVREFLTEFGAQKHDSAVGDAEFARLAQMERDLRAQIALERAGMEPFSAGDRLSRDELYDTARSKFDASDGGRG